MARIASGSSYLGERLGGRRLAAWAAGVRDLLGEGQVFEDVGFFSIYSKIDRNNDDQLADLEDGLSRSKTY